MSPTVENSSGKFVKGAAQSASAAKPVPAKSSAQGVDLLQLFSAASQSLASNQSSLNRADPSGVHGDHIVQTFQLITNAISATQGKPPADQLAYASSQLAGQAKTSGSAQVYAQGLAQAAQQFQTQKAITPDMALTLVQTLLAGGQAQAPASQPASAGADLLGQLLGGMQQQQPSGPTSQPAAGADLLGQLLGGTQQQPSSGGAQGGLDVGDLLNAGMSFLQAKQSGQDNMQAAVSALMSASPLGQTPHRQQSGEVVATALLQAISAFAKK